MYDQDRMMYSLMIFYINVYTYKSSLKFVNAVFD